MTHQSFVPPDVLLYAASKGAIEQLTRVLAKDLAPRGITVNCVAPGPIDTDMFRQGKSEEAINFYLGVSPAKRFGQPEEVADVVAFMASKDFAWVNGQTLLVNGVRLHTSAKAPIRFTHFYILSGPCCVTSAFIKSMNHFNMQQNKNVLVHYRIWKEYRRYLAD